MKASWIDAWRKSSTILSIANSFRVTDMIPFIPKESWEGKYREAISQFLSPVDNSDNPFLQTSRCAKFLETYFKTIKDNHELWLEHFALLPSFLLKQSQFSKLCEYLGIEAKEDLDILRPEKEKLAKLAAFPNTTWSPENTYLYPPATRRRVFPLLCAHSLPDHPLSSLPKEILYSIVSTAEQENAPTLTEKVYWGDDNLIRFFEKNNLALRDFFSDCDYISLVLYYLNHSQ